MGPGGRGGGWSSGDAVLRPGRQVGGTAGPHPEPHLRLQPHDRSPGGSTTGTNGPSAARRSRRAEATPGIPVQPSTITSASRAATAARACPASASTSRSPGSRSRTEPAVPQRTPGPLAHPVHAVPFAGHLPGGAAPVTAWPV
ncbi:hypothetical protein GTY87_05235 [Streptomyces sp. SID7813]|uniref:Uncharacterized protein n=1 Tax=Streptomyces coelicolor (strain ATCC BAA-471 / A3(2) / M145) TaxID=100226 RepID=Q9K3K7_STRCO|nr:hypothetical protein [Streptomyces sp. SID7813]QFI41286.1 hypothetical protein FQ762_05275 [Streptomyces coelicolor A3(2)]CAB96038.1 hypothetical protein SCG20A.33c [Streptomyces coelicolor A3(2)]